MIAPGDMVAAGRRVLTVVAILPSGKLKLDTGAIVPAKGVRVLDATEVAVVHAARSAKQDREFKKTIRLLRELERSLNVPAGYFGL